MHGRVQADAPVPVAAAAPPDEPEILSGFAAPPIPAPVAAVAPAARLGLPSYSAALSAVGLAHQSHSSVWPHLGCLPGVLHSLPLAGSAPTSDCPSEFSELQAWTWLSFKLASSLLGLQTDL